MFIYEKLFALLEVEGITTYKIFKNKVISRSTFYDFKANRPVSTKSLDHLCAFLQSQFGDIMELIPDEYEPIFTKANSIYKDI